LFNFAGADIAKVRHSVNYWRKMAVDSWLISELYFLLLFWLFLHLSDIFSEYLSYQLSLICSWKSKPTANPHFSLCFDLKEYVHAHKYFCICINCQSKVKTLDLQTSNKSGDYELLRKRAWVWNARAILPTKMEINKLGSYRLLPFSTTMYQQQHIYVYDLRRWIWEGWWIPCEKRQEMVWNKRTRCTDEAITSAQMSYFNWIRQLCWC